MKPLPIEYYEVMEVADVFCGGDIVCIRRFECPLGGTWLGTSAGGRVRIGMFLRTGRGRFVALAVAEKPGTAGLPDDRGGTAGGNGTARNGNM